MNVVRLVEEVYGCASFPRAFTLAELSDFTSLKVELLYSVASTDPELICLKSDLPDEDRFILSSVFCRWLINLNIGLAKLKKYKLNKHQLSILMSHLRLEGSWSDPPINAIKWGQSLGLVSPCLTTENYVFPLAYILSYLPEWIDLIKETLYEFGTNKDLKAFSRMSRDAYLEKGFSLFRPKITNIVKMRSGLLISGGKKVTLEKAGNSSGITRSRVQQIESIFWKNLKSRSKLYMRNFLIAFLYDFINESGSLLIKSKSPNANLREFLAKCVGIPIVNLSQIEYSILTASESNFTEIISRGFSLEEIEPNVIANCLESQTNIPFTSNDVGLITESISLFRKKKHLTVLQKVILSLRSIGRPAHYSKVAEVHNALFPNNQKSEHNIHAVLCRKQGGIVWIGVKGTYALKEWGFERPAKPLFDSVSEIVKNIYSRTGKPVPYQVIVAEIGKQRKIIKPSSLIFATHLNPELALVSKDTFIPKEFDRRIKDEIPADQLDNLLEKFQKERHK